LFLEQKHLGIFWIIVFSSVNLTKFAKLLGKKSPNLQFFKFKLKKLIKNKNPALEKLEWGKGGGDGLRAHHVGKRMDGVLW
jgi:hypothetical protein